MTKIKMGGIVLTGVGAFLILSKGLSVIDRGVRNLTDAAKWKAYYKSFEKTGPTKDMTVPEMQIKYIEKEPENKEESPASEALKGAIKDAIEKLTDILIERREAGKSGLKTSENGISEDIYEEPKENDQDSQVTDEIFVEEIEQ